MTLGCILTKLSTLKILEMTTYEGSKMIPRFLVWLTAKIAFLISKHDGEKDLKVDIMTDHQRFDCGVQKYLSLEVLIWSSNLYL